MTPDMTRSLIIWGLWITLFLALEMPAVFGAAPWHTFSTTSTFVIHRTGRIGAFIVPAGLAILAVHFVAPKTYDKIQQRKVTKAKRTLAKHGHRVIERPPA